MKTKWAQFATAECMKCQRNKNRCECLSLTLFLTPQQITNSPQSEFYNAHFHSAADKKVRVNILEKLCPLTEQFLKQEMREMW